ncbi:MAG: hypothetical protein JWL78_499, partial [Chloroflexi bacterium]|nr:hypothetical protein [Chloroflexota bacterium]
RPPRLVARHRALARPMPAPAPPRRHSPAALASRSQFGAATRRGTTRATPALLLENPTIRGDGGRLGAAGKAVMPMRGLKHPPVKPLGGSIVSNAQRCSWSLGPSTLHVKRATRASPASAGVEGGMPRHRARQRTMSCDRTGGTQSPPSKNRRQNDSRPAAERPDANLNRRQNRRASPPAAEPPRNSTPAADQPRLAPGGRSAEHPHPAAELPGISTGGRTMHNRAS